MTPTQGEHAQTALAHELFAAAQLAPGEGIEDAVSRIAAALAAAPTPAAQADSVLDDAARLALTALHSCTIGGYTDVDGDFVRTYYFKKVAVDAAIKALAARKQGGKHD